MTTDAMEYFASIRPNNVIKIKNAREEGQKVVGSYCTYCPNELILAAGAIPVGLCGTSENPIPAAEEVLPRNLCPLIKSSFGFARTDTCPFFALSDFIIGETTCDGKKKMFEQMQEIKSVHVMQLPHQMQVDGALDLWISEIKRLKIAIESAFDTVISDEKLWAAINTINRETAVMKEICDLNRQNPAPIKGSEMLTVSWSRFFNVDHEETIEMAKLLGQQVLTRQSGAAGPRILLTGCPVGVGTEKVIKIIEEIGGQVVVSENCSGYKTLEIMTDTSISDPYVALAMKYSQIPCSCMTPNEGRMDLLKRLINDFSVDAVVDLTWQACHTYNIEAFDVEKLVKGLEKPYLHLESDYSASDAESLKLRLEALLEMAAK